MSIDEKIKGKTGRRHTINRRHVDTPGLLRAADRDDVDSDHFIG
jgi:hypothetical protein